jgi:hypothetical protein
MIHCYTRPVIICIIVTLGFEVDLSEIVDPHTVAGLLKLHFREQRVSMIPRGPILTSITQAVKDKNVRMSVYP